MTATDDFPPIDPAALARAEAALAALEGRYIAWAEADLARLEAAWADLAAGSEGAGDIPSGPARRRLFSVAHDMKGQAATFGYPLVGDFANCLCRIVESADDLDPADHARSERLVAAVGRVIRERLSGDGGAEGQALRLALVAAGICR
jgi:hypothetical protein